MKVTLVGAGPGDPGLLTLRGKNALANADVVVYDALANDALLAHAKAGAELIYVGKVAGDHALPQDEINELLALKALENGGQNVARLKGGDPYIFGRGGEEAFYLQSRGIPFEEIPGVSSAIAAPAYAGIPLTHRGYVSSLTILTGHEAIKEKSSLNWRALAESGSTLVIVMGVKNLPDIAAKLIAAGMAPDTPAAIIYKGATPEQKSLRATLANLPREAKEGGFSNPSVIVIGRVAELAGTLDWFSRKALLGKTIVVTRAREQASELAERLEELGARVLQSPSIAVRPLEDYSAVDAAIKRVETYDWLVFTSVNGVKFFWERLAAEAKDTRALYRAKVAAIGPATANALAKVGVFADIVPPAYVAEEVVKMLGEYEGDSLAGKKILIPRALKARSTLPDGLSQAGAKVEVAPVYQTVPEKGASAEIRALLAVDKLDCVTFASSSTVTNFLDAIPPEELKARPRALLAAIGPITAETLASYGLKADIVPAKYDIPGLCAAIVSRFTDAQKSGNSQCP